MRLRRPSVFACLLLLAGLLFFVSLGNWQMRRAQEKQTQLDAFNAGNSARAVNLQAATERFPQEAYVSVEIKGEFVAGKSLLLDSARLNGQIGVQVYQAFESEGKSVLVGLGFVPIRPDRSQFPTPATPVGTQVLRGLYGAPPSSGIRLNDLESNAQSNTWLVTRIDPKTQQAFFARKLEAGVILLAPVAKPGIDPNDVLQLERVWHSTAMPPERHLGYAMTWYGFAITAIVIFLILHRRRS
jgi:surfeit locus 1 family protein